MKEAKKIYNPLDESLKTCKKAFIITFMFAFAVNIMNLITPLYSLQVLDRVISSGNTHTLLMLSVIIAVVYGSYTLLQIARSFTLIKIGEWLDKRISPELFNHAISESAIKPSLSASQAIREFSSIKSFLTSVGINSLFDAPWSIVYIIVVFLIHPYLGWLTIFACILALFLAFLNAYAINSTLSESSDFNIKGHQIADLSTRHAETIQAMGMIKSMQSRWSKMNSKSLEMQSVASYRNGVISNISRFLRSLVQMAVTGIGAYVVITTNSRDMTVGNMIATSIIVGRALTPFDQAIEVWKQASSALKSYKTIKSSFEKKSEHIEGMSIPNPSGKLVVENVFFEPHNRSNQPHQNQLPQGQSKYILRGINFEIEAGTTLAIVGPSAAGKSTLARLLVGIWKPNQGSVRLDNSDVFDWNREDFGKHVGYLPQTIELFNGSIKENIARMAEEPDPELVVKASKLAGAHEMISRMPNGYETDIGVGGSNLSGGQRQRVALARAFYGTPKLVVLDEPNANLDDAGEKALLEAINKAKSEGVSVILISHRPSVLAFVDKILIVQEGQIAAFGSREEIMAKFAAAQQASSAPKNSSTIM